MLSNKSRSQSPFPFLTLRTVVFIVVAWGVGPAPALSGASCHVHKLLPVPASSPVWKHACLDWSGCSHLTSTYAVAVWSQCRSWTCMNWKCCLAEGRSMQLSQSSAEKHWGIRGSLFMPCFPWILCFCSIPASQETAEQQMAMSSPRMSRITCRL